MHYCKIVIERKKWKRFNDSESGTHSEAQSVEPQLFNPSLDREDKEEFKFEAPERVGSFTVNPACRLS